jgi:DNA modification methylase
MFPDPFLIWALWIRWFIGPFPVQFPRLQRLCRRWYIGIWLMCVICSLVSHLGLFVSLIIQEYVFFIAVVRRIETSRNRVLISHNYVTIIIIWKELDFLMISLATVILSNALILKDAFILIFMVFLELEESFNFLDLCF